MTTNIQLLRSSVAFKRPSAAPLLDGQAAVNYNAAEPGLFFRLTDGSLTKVGPVAMTVDGSRPNSAPAGQTGNSLGEQWLNASPVLFRPVQYVHNGTEFVTSNGFVVDEASGQFTLERTLFAQRLESNSLFVEGPAVIGGNITPNGQNCAYFLGGPAERWDFGYLCNLDVSGSVIIGDNAPLDCTNTFEINATSVFNCPVTFNDDVAFPGVTDFVFGQGCGTGTVTLDAETFVNCDTVFSGDVDFQSANLTLGTGCGASTIILDGEATLRCDTTLSQDLTVNGNTQLNGDLGVAGEATFDGDVTFNSPNMTLGNGCATSTVTLNGATTFNCDVVPGADNTLDLGSPALRFANIYTGDLHLKNDRGDWTMIEEEDYLTLRNNKTGKTFRLLMEEV